MNDKVDYICCPYLKYGYRRHCGGLKESLATSVYIRSDSFMKMLLSGNFYPYAFDDRCKQVLWLSKDSHTWLFIEISKYSHLSNNVDDFFINNFKHYER